MPYWRRSSTGKTGDRYHVLIAAPRTRCAARRHSSAAATDNGLLAPERAAGIARVKSQPCSWAVGRAGPSGGASTR